MTKWKRFSAAVMSAAMAATLFTGTAFAAEDRTKISKVTLTVSSSIEAGDDSSDVTVTTDADTYSVTDIDVTNDDGEWVSGDEPRVEITLEADDDYYFDSMSSSKVKLSGDDATYVSSSRKDDKSTLVVIIRLDELVGSLEVENASWENDNSPIAQWDETDGAKSYQVRLYRDSSSVGSAVSVTGTSYNFASLITRTGEFSFRVRALDKNSKKGEWIESDSFYVDDNMLEDIKAGTYGSSSSSTSTSPSTSTPTSAQWIQDSTGWWYRFADGTYPTNGWLQIGGIWYCFDSVGYMRTGWIQSGSNWYYCDTNSGAMLTDTRTPDNYYVDANGVWIVGR